MITSSDSPRFRYFSRLKKKKERLANDMFLVEGVHLVEEALKAGSLDRAIYSSRIKNSQDGRRIIRAITNAGLPCEETADRLISDLSSVEAPQGLIASARPKGSDLGVLFEEPFPLIVIACGIQDPGNLGTIIRTADAAGCSGVIVTHGSVDPYNEKVIRSTAGSIFHLNIIKNDDIIELIPSLKRRGINVIATDADSEKKYFEADLKGKTAVIVGNEGQGLPVEITRLCSETISIPMKGQAESLNAAVAAALVMYESVRQRTTDAG